MSIETRRRKRDGRTVYDVRLRDPSGREYSRTFPTKRAAEAYEAKERVDRNRGVWVDPREADTTFGELGKAGLESNPGKTESCATRDEGIVRTTSTRFLKLGLSGRSTAVMYRPLSLGGHGSGSREQSVASSTFYERSSITRLTAMSSAGLHAAVSGFRSHPSLAGGCLHQHSSLNWPTRLARLMHRWSTREPCWGCGGVSALA